MFRRTLILTAIALLAASLGACGDSSEDEATAKVCDGATTDSRQFWISIGAPVQAVPGPYSVS